MLPSYSVSTRWRFLRGSPEQRRQSSYASHLCRASSSRGRQKWTHSRNLGIRSDNAVSLRITNQSTAENKEQDSDDTKNKNPFSNFNELLQTAQTAQAQATQAAQRVQQELSQVEFDGYDEEEMVRVVMTGNQEPRSVELTESVLELDIRDIEQHIVDAMKDAHSKSVEGMKSRMQQLYTDLGFPMPPKI